MHALNALTARSDQKASIAGFGWMRGNIWLRKQPVCAAALLVSISAISK